MSVRPRSIIWFERTAILLLAVGALQFYQNLFRPNSMSGELYRQRTLGVSLYALLAAATLLLIWLIGRRGSALAKYFYVSLNLARVAESIIVPLAFRDMRVNLPWLAWVQLTLMAIAIWLLFRRDSRDWFAGHRPVDPEIFR